MTGSPQRRGGCLAAVLVVAFAAGCGARPPQAPVAEAHRLGQATGAIATSCGRSYRATAFGDEARRVRQIDRHTLRDARELIAVYRRNPGWVYLGQTVDQTTRDAISMTRDCGLRQVAALLARGRGFGR